MNPIIDHALNQAGFITKNNEPTTLCRLQYVECAEIETMLMMTRMMARARLDYSIG
jgi:hypothetical protein